MATGTLIAPPSAAARWTGRVISALPVLMLLMSGVMKLVQEEMVVKGSEKLGWVGEELLFVLGVLEITCALIYAYPRTAVLGAILVTGFMGGAVATHVRVGEPPIGALLAGVLVWLGLYLREPRLRALVPLRS